MDTSEALDLSKENIQPLKQGRNPTQLGTALQAQTNTEVHQQLTKEREKFELEIRLYEGNDPLKPRYEYVAWLEQSFPKHGRESNLIPLLEDTLTTFKDDDRYKQDQRFVELLVKYFDTQPNPLELYQIVYNQGLGTMCSLFYHAWAYEFDKNNDTLRADQIYSLGIKNRAQPLEQLVETHRLFQLSVGRRTLGYVDKNIDNADSYSREVLSRLTNKKKVPSIREGNGAPGTWQQMSSNSINHNQKQKAPVKVFQDEANNENFPSCGFIEAGSCGTFPTTSALQKENSLKAGPWSGQNHRSRHVPKPPTTPTFKVHEDEGEVGDYPQRPGTVVPRALKPKKQDTFTCQLAFFEPPDPTKQPMYCKNKVYVGGREFQFEELRAADYLRRFKQPKLENEGEQKQILTSVSESDNLGNKFEEQHSESEKVQTPAVKGRPEDDLNNITPEEVQSEPNQALTVDVNEVPIPSTSEVQEPVSVHSVFVDKEHEIQAHTADVDEVPISSTPEVLAPVSVHSVLENKQLAIQKFGGKGPLDANASLNASSKEAMHLVQEMWGSPSPLKIGKQALSKHRSCLPTVDENNDGVFKVPLAPRPIILPFTLYTDEEPSSKPAETSAKNSGQFSVFTDDDDLAQSNFPTVGQQTQSKRTTTFPIYSDDFEKDEFPSSSYGLPGDKTRKELDNIESSESKKPLIQGKPLLGLIAKVIEPSEDVSENKRETMNSNDFKGFILDNHSGQNCLYPSKAKENFALPATNNAVSKCLVYRDESDNQMKQGTRTDKYVLETQFVGKADEVIQEPFHQMISEQSVPLQYQFKGITPQGQFQQPQVNGFQLNNDDNDVTCNTKAFAFALPSSTPMNNHFQSGPAQQVNVSYMAEELQPKAVLSKILEASNERGTSSSSGSGSVGTQLLQSSEVKQRLPPVSSSDISEVEKSIGTISLVGDIDPFSSDFTSKLLTFIDYPKPYHLPGVHYLDKDLSPLCVNSTVILGSMKYILQGELGKGAFARVLKAKKGEKVVALKYQKPGLVWELYIAQELQLRLRKLNSPMIGGFLEINNAFIFKNSTVFETEWAAFGSLLNVVNTVKTKANKVIPLNIVVMISIQLVSIVEHLHKCNIIHGDIKPDNFVVSSLSLLDSKQICIKLIDFGRSIDMTLLPSGTTFTTVVTTEDFTCTEMLDKKPWTYQVDTYGLAGTIVLLLISDYMKIVKKDQKWQLKTALPRYCNRNLWDPILSSLLNIESCDKQPNLAEYRQSLEMYLEIVEQATLKSQLNTFTNILNGR